MRVLASIVLSIGLAAAVSACGGSKKEDTTPAANTAPAAEGEQGAENAAAPEGEEEGGEAADKGDMGGEDKDKDKAGGGW